MPSSSSSSSSSSTSRSSHSSRRSTTLGAMRLSLIAALLGALLLFVVSPSFVQSRAILGVDLGSLYMKVALVQSGSPLEIVTNLHSKRKTEQMILFDRSQRFYGADAAALLARKSMQTPSAMSVLLGRDEQHPIVKVLTERHNPIALRYNESRSGVVLTVDGIDFTPEELVAMVLSHAVDIAVAHAASQGSNSLSVQPPRDVVLTTPSFATQHEKRALLDAAQLANLNVLELIDETTAAAVQYAMDKSFDDEQLLLFYNMGASALQVSLIRFHQTLKPERFGKPKSVPAVEVLSKAWDSTLGGDAFDHLIVEYLAEQFNHAWYKTGRATKDKGDDVRKFPRAMTKLKLQANKVKHVLSANTEFPVYMDAVHDDVSLSTHLTRELLEELAAPLWHRALKPIDEVLLRANCTWANVTGMELLGGGMRIPRLQNELQSILAQHTNSSIELGLHMNADEAMALGAAFVGANVSTAFRVRHVGLTDVNPFAVQVTLSNLPNATVDTKASGKKKPDKTKNAEEEEWTKQAVVFKSFGKLGVKRTITFTHDQDVHCAIDYVIEPPLPNGTNTAIERYNLTGVSAFAQEMVAKNLTSTKPKVSLQFELGTSGITTLVRAEASMEETYVVEEEIEVVDEEAAANLSASNESDSASNASAAATNATSETGNASGTNGTSSDAANATSAANTTTSKPLKKPTKKILVPKEKKRVHRKPLQIAFYHEGRVQPHSPEQLQASKDKLLDMATKDKERMMLEEARNKLESYIYKVKNKLEDELEAISKVSTEEQRETCRKLAVDAEEWMYDDGYKADLATMIAKYEEVSTPFDQILRRLSEVTARPAALEALKKRLTEIEQLMAKWATERPQVTEGERTGVLEKLEDIRKWMSDQEAAQATKKPHEEPVFWSIDVPNQSKLVEAMVVRLSKKPKPKPPKVNVTKTGDNNATDANATTSATASDEGSANATSSNDTTASSNATASPTNETDEGDLKEGEEL